jgi:NitT/TauT family transport system permease protein
MTYTMDVSGQFSVLLILSVVGLLLNRLVYLVRRRVLFWDPSEKGVEVPEGEVTARTPLAASGAAKESAA